MLQIRWDVLSDLIDDKLLSQAAKKAGIVVAPDEVDLTIKTGLVEPIKSGSFPPEVVQLMEQALRVHGITVDDALTNEAIRAAYEGLVARGRFLQSRGQSREEVLPDLRSAATIVKPVATPSPIRP